MKTLIRVSSVKTFRGEAQMKSHKHRGKERERETRGSNSCATPFSPKGKRLPKSDNDSDDDDCDDNDDQSTDDADR